MEVLRVTNNKELGEVLELRYRVYCEEKHFVEEEECPEHSESDEFDRAATHFSVKEDGVGVVGTVRLVLDSPLGFPLEAAYKLSADVLPPHVRRTTAEISRFAVSKERRGSAYRTYTKAVHTVLMEEASRLKLTHFVAIMTKALARRSKMLGIQWTPLSGPVEFHGELRVVYILEIAK